MIGTTHFAALLLVLLARPAVAQLKDCKKRAKQCGPSTGCALPAAL